MGEVMTPWADDEVQTTDPEQNFLNPAFDGKRGLTSGVHPFSGFPAASTILNPDGAVYQEFMHVADRDRYQTFAQLQSDAIKTVMTSVSRAASGTRARRLATQVLLPDSRRTAHSPVCCRRSCSAR